MSYLLVIVLLLPPPMFAGVPSVTSIPEPDLATCNAEGVQVLREGGPPSGNVQTEFFSCLETGKVGMGEMMRGIDSVPHHLPRAP